MYRFDPFVEQERLKGQLEFIAKSMAFLIVEENKIQVHLANLPRIETTCSCGSSGDQDE
jgi:hypothetical protein